MQVLLGTDEFAPAAGARALVRKIVRHDAQLTVLSSATFEWVVPEQRSLQLDNPQDRHLRAETIAGRAAAELAADGFEVKPMVTEGDAGRRLVEQGREGGYDLIVVGGGRHSWLGNLILGSTSTYVLRHAPCAVLVVHESPTGEGRLHTLLAHDGSPGAERALRFMEELVDPAQVEITIATIVPGWPMGAAPLLAGQPPMSEPGVYDEERLEQARAEAERVASEAADKLRSAGFQADAVVSSGHVTTQLLKEAEGRGSRLVVTGAEHPGGVERLLTGSISDAVARLAPATLVVPA